MTGGFAEHRARMVEGQLRTTDVTDPDLLQAMLTVPRELYVDEKCRPLAYIDQDIEIAPPAAGSPPRYLMKPSPFGKLVQLAQVGPDDKVLVVGAGTGYSAAVLARLAARVTAIECDPALADRARSLLADSDNVTVVTGNLPDGHAALAPYDVILVEGAVDRIPDTLTSQLAEGGRLVVVVGHGNAGFARVYVRNNGSVTSRRAFNAAVKPLPGFERTPSFEF